MSSPRWYGLQSGKVRGLRLEFILVLQFMILVCRKHLCVLLISLSMDVREVEDLRQNKQELRGCGETLAVCTTSQYDTSLNGYLWLRFLRREPRRKALSHVASMATGGSWWIRETWEDASAPLTYYRVSREQNLLTVASKPEGSQLTTIVKYMNTRLP